MRPVLIGVVLAALSGSGCQWAENQKNLCHNCGNFLTTCKLPESRGGSGYDDFTPPDNSGKVPQICGWCHGSGESQIDPGSLRCPRCHGAGITTENP